jgi:hypothetical protein
MKRSATATAWLTLAAGAAAHMALARLLPDPWLVPDLTAVGLTLAIVRKPRKWLPLACAAGGFTMLWALRAPHAFLLGYLVIGRGLRVLVDVWDGADLRIQGLLCGLASALLTAGCLWGDRLWSFEALGLALARTGMTAVVPAAAAGIRRLASGGFGSAEGPQPS